MARIRTQLSTGLPGLDRVFRGLMPGDNIVWQIDSIEDYLPFVEPFGRYARENAQKLVYFRYADHRPLLARFDGLFDTMVEVTDSLVARNSVIRYC